MTTSTTTTTTTTTGHLAPANLKPMLASPIDLTKIRYPVMVQPKFDGIRALAVNGQALSRTLKPIPNKFVQSLFANYAQIMHGMDGELVVGSPNDPKTFERTTSGVMSFGGEPDFTYVVFDNWDNPSPDYAERFDSVRIFGKAHPRIRILEENIWASCEEQLFLAKWMLLEKGYEGAIVRHRYAPYKFGRSRPSDGALIKFKDFEDTEAQVVGFQQFYHNANEGTIDRMGHLKRSSHKANKIPEDMLGALVCSSPKWAGTFCIGSGFDMALRQEIWHNQANYLNRLVKFKYLKPGTKDLPRHPIFLSFRDPIDVGDPSA